jgi:hypothetical protein
MFNAKKWKIGRDSESARHSQPPPSPKASNKNDKLVGGLQSLETPEFKQSSSSGIEAKPAASDFEA